MFAYDPELRLAISDDDSSDFPDEETAKTIPSSETPLSVDEWRSCLVRFYGAPAPSFALLEQTNTVRRISGHLWEVNFRNHVGLARLGNLDIRVQNRKMSDALYQSMLDELAEHYASLVFEFGSPVGQHYDKGSAGRDSAFVEYLFLSKHLLHATPDLSGLGEIIAHDPHRKFRRERLSCAIEECQTADNDMVLAMINGPMARLHDEHPLQRTHLAGTLQAKTGQSFFPPMGVKERKYLTVDTHENRFVKFFLRMLLAKVEHLRRALGSNTGSYLNPDINENLDKLEQKIDQVLAHNMWREIGEMRFLPANSQVLQRREGYRQLFRLYSLLQLATRCDFLETDFRNLAEIKDVPTLYEYWSFFQVKKVMDALAPACKIGKLIDENQLTHEISIGLRIEYRGGVSLFFNKTYRGSSILQEGIAIDGGYQPAGDSYSHHLCPDIVIARQDGKKLIFDAKYKGNRPGFYCEEDSRGEIKEPKNEDIDKMHTYREAIKDVKGSFILYPGIKNVIYPRHGANSMTDGVGALALRPGEPTSNGQRSILMFIEAFLQNESNQTSKD